MNKSNIKFVYLYRDSGNYKKWGDIIFQNINNLSTDRVTSLLETQFDSDGIFIVAQVRVPEIFLFTEDCQLNEDDHCFHEFSNVEYTNESCDDKHNRDIQEFINEVAIASKEGWKSFDPNSRPNKFMTLKLAEPES